MIFRIFKNRTRGGKGDQGTEESNSSVPPILLEALDDDDYLGRAAQAKHLAANSIRSKDYDSAWSLLHDQKSNYLSHANREKFTVDQTLALDSTVHEVMANVLRLEGRHNEALVDIVYWVTAQSRSPKKAHKSKFNAYFKRCKFSNTNIDSAVRQMNSIKPPHEFIKARSLVKRWIELK